MVVFALHVADAFNLSYYYSPMKYTGPKAKKVRRQGVNIYGSDKYDKILQKKPYGPGKSPKSRPGRKSEYANQLTEKQKARDMYGLSERQFRRLYDTASASGGETGLRLRQLLETRLDNTIFKAGFAMTRLQSRQFVGHGLFLVNGVRVTSPSYQVSEGDKIEIRAKTKSSPVFQAISDAHDKYTPPAWMKVDAAAKKIEVLSVPVEADLEQAVDARQIIELYSR